MCEAGLASSAEDAKQQDLELCRTILVERYFVLVYEEMKRDPKTLTPEREKFMEMMERLSNQ